MDMTTLTLPNWFIVLCALSSLFGGAMIGFALWILLAEWVDTLKKARVKRKIDAELHRSVKDYLKSELIK